MKSWNRLRRSAMQSIARASLPVLGVPKASVVVSMTKLEVENTHFNVEDYVLSEAHEKFDEFDESFYGKPFVGSARWYGLRDLELQVEEDRDLCLNLIHFCVRRPAFQWIYQERISWKSWAAAWVMRRRHTYYWKGAA